MPQKPTMTKIVTKYWAVFNFEVIPAVEVTFNVHVAFFRVTNATSSFAPSPTPSRGSPPPTLRNTELTGVMACVTKVNLPYVRVRLHAFS